MEHAAYTRCSDILFVPAGEEGALVRWSEGSADLHQVCALNPTAALIWLALESGPASVDELVRMLVAEFEVEASEARADLLTMLRKLEDEGYVAGA